MNGSGIQLAIISDNESCLQRLKDTVLGMGYAVSLEARPEDVSLLDEIKVDLWLLYLTDEDRWADFVDQIIEHSDAPTLFGNTNIPLHDSTDLMRWNRHLLEKITKQVGPPSSQGQTTLALLQNTTQKLRTLELRQDLVASATPGRKLDNALERIKPSLPTSRNTSSRCAQYNDEVTRVWVLGASLGGPAAVKEFLDVMPENLPIAFILAQHIDKGFQKVLSQVLARHSHFEVCKETIGQKVEYGKVYIAPVEQVIDFEAGRIVGKNETWQGPYAPSIDQVMRICTEYYGTHCGTILFSGMGSDGAIYAPEQVKNGGRVWAQTADTCASSSMPDSARQTGCVSYSGSPKQLALQLIAHVRRELKNDEHAIKQPVAF